MGRDAEQGLGHLPDALLVEVLQVLAGQKHGGLLFAHPLETVADVLDGSGIGQPDIQLVQGGHGISLGEELVGHIGQHIEEHGIADISRRTEHPLHTEDQEAAGGNVRVSVEELGIGALAHGVQPQQHLLQKFLCVERVTAGIVRVKLLLHQVVEVGEDGVVLRAHLRKVGVLGDAELLVQLGEHDFDGVDVGIAEILVGSEEVFQEGDVLSQHGIAQKGFGYASTVVAGGKVCCPDHVRVRIASSGTLVVPALGFQDIDEVVSGHEVGKATTHRLAHLLLLMFGIQGDDGFARLQQIEDEKLHEVGLALSGVAQDQDVGRGLVLVSLVEVHQNVAAVFVFADVEALGVQLAGVVERVQVGHGTGWQHPFKLDSEDVVTTGTHTAEALLLTEQELVHVQLASNQLGEHIGLE